MLEGDIYDFPLLPGRRDRGVLEQKERVRKINGTEKENRRDTNLTKRQIGGKCAIEGDVSQLDWEKGTDE